MVDYIKREDALSYLPQYPLDYSFEQTQAFMKGFIQLRKYIVGCPTADVVERKRGYNAKADYPSLFECSLCGWSDYDTMTGDSIEYNYCPNCGARVVNHE